MSIKNNLTFSILICLSSTFSYADTAVQEAKNKKWLNQGEIKEMPKEPKSNAKISTTMTCKSASGKVYKSNESGFDNCLNEIEMDKAKSATDNEKDKKEDKKDAAKKATVTHSFEIK